MKAETKIIFSETLHSMMLQSMDDAEIAATLGCEVVEEDHGPAARIPAGWYEVTWSEHLLHHDFNSDASYGSLVAVNAKELTEEQFAMVYHLDARQADRERFAVA